MGQIWPKSPQSLWPILLRKLLRKQSMNVNIRIPVRLLHARGSPADATDFFGALVEDVADRDGDVDTVLSSESAELI